MLRVVRGDRLDALLDAMLDAFDRSPLPPPMRELIVVQGRGLDRWISQQAALRRGGWGFAETLYPRPFLLRAFAAVLDGGVPYRMPDDGSQRLDLELRVAAAMPSLLRESRFPALAAAFGAIGESSGSIDDAALECAPLVAQALDRCAQHRVDLVERWQRERGDGRSGEHGDGRRGSGAVAGGAAEPGDEAWLAELWRRGAAATPPSRLLVERERFLDRCRSERGGPIGMPPRASVFGVSTLAPAFLELLAALSRRMDITVYALDPGAGDRRHALAAAWGIESAEFEALVAALGHAGDATLERLEPQHGQGRAQPGESPPSRRLAALQGALRSGVEAEDRSGSGAANPAPRDPGSTPPSDAVDDPIDDSLQLLPGRGRLGEVERVHDAIVDLLERDPTLEPRDVALLTPDLETYGPIVEAVFGSRRDARDRPVLPFAVADRDAGELDAVEALARLVDAALGRISRRDLLELLAVESIGRAFGVGGAELERLERWSTMACVRWGLDAEHRALHGRPGETIGTWQWGLDRLRLGAVMADGALGAMGIDEPVAPCAAVELGEMGVLDAAQALLDAIEPLAKRANDRLPLAAAGATGSADASGSAGDPGAAGSAGDDWISMLERIADVLAGANDSTGAHRGIEGAAALRVRLDEIRRTAIDAGIGKTHRVRARTAIRFLVERLRTAHPGRALLAAGVTVAAIQPMRSIPFRVIALVGMAEGEFPRAARFPSFDLVAAAPRPGDRNPRLDDRQVMLETVMAASRSLLISWPGVDPTTGTELPPSVVVSELIDAVPGLRAATGTGREPAVVTGGHDPAEPRADARARGAAGIAPGAGASDTVVSAGAGPSREPAGPRRMTLDELIRFWRSPPEAYLRARRVFLDRPEREADDEDPVDREHEKELLLEVSGGEAAWIDSAPERPARAVLRGRGLLARGIGGDALAQEVTEQIGRWRSDAEQLLASMRAGASFPAREVKLVASFEIESVRAPSTRRRSVTLEGVVPMVEGVGPLLVVPRGTDEHAFDMLRGWLRLLLCTVAASEAPLGLLVLGRRSSGRGGERTHEVDARLVRAPPKALARAHLTAFASLALEGSEQPLAWMPKSSLEYAHHCEKKSPEPSIALAKAREKFFDEGDEQRGRGDGFEPAVRIVFGPERFFDARGEFGFEALAERVARPISRAFKDGVTTAALRRGLDAADAGAAARKRRGA